MSEERENDVRNGGERTPSSRPAARNPFADPKTRNADADVPALIESRRTAAFAGVIVGLVALVLVVAICVAASMAFG
jgi:hypothetical protein